MSDLTPNLKLFKYDPVADAKQPFNITKAWNNNWDIIDKNAGGVPIGFIYPAVLGIDESDNKYRYLNGQILLQDQYVNFTSWVKSRMNNASSAFCTEDEWQSIQANSKLGQCGKFVVDDTNGTIRLPRVINIQGLTDLANCGLIKDESLPNITGKTTGNSAVDTRPEPTGAFYRGSIKETISAYQSLTTSLPTLFDASRSSSTYKDDAPVQQEAIQYPYVICVNSGVEEAEKPINNYQINNTNSYGDNKYVGDMTLNNASWLKSIGQANSGTVYTGFYNWAVANIGQPFGGGLIKESTATDITDYDLVVNQEEQTFILPTLNGSENTMSGKYSAMNITGSPYTFIAPANGWLYMSGTPVNSNDEYVTVYIDKAKTTPIIGRTALTHTSITYLVPVFKGQEVIIEYTVSNISRCKFIYAKGNGNLYYYVGDTLQNVDIMNVARIEETLTDINSPSRGYLVESYQSDTTSRASWYRMWSDGWCEQGGLIPDTTFGSGKTATVTLLKQLKDVPLPNVTCFYPSSRNTPVYWGGTLNTSNSIIKSITFQCSTVSPHCLWKVEGYLA